MPATPVTIPTRDGTCPAHLLTPNDDDSSNGPWPPIVFYSDAGGIRPAMVDMAQRLADAGYAVLLPDPFYRHGPYGPLVPKDVFASGDPMAILGPLMASTGNDKAVDDTAAYLAWLDGRDAVAQGNGSGSGSGSGNGSGGKVGAVGFCMGGGMALSAAGAFPDRFAAVASFHGGNLATDAPDSPHLRAGRIRGEVYIAAAENDDLYPPEMAQRLERALREGGVRYTAETYAGAAHGWMVTDFPVWDAVAAERGWGKTLALFERLCK